MTSVSALWSGLRGGGVSRSDSRSQQAYLGERLAGGSFKLAPHTISRIVVVVRVGVGRTIEYHSQQGRVIEWLQALFEHLAFCHALTSDQQHAIGHAAPYIRIGYRHQWRRVDDDPGKQCAHASQHAAEFRRLQQFQRVLGNRASRHQIDPQILQVVDELFRRPVTEQELSQPSAVRQPESVRHNWLAQVAIDQQNSLKFVTRQRNREIARHQALSFLDDAAGDQKPLQRTLLLHVLQTRSEHPELLRSQPAGISQRHQATVFGNAGGVDGLKNRTLLESRLVGNDGAWTGIQFPQGTREFTPADSISARETVP